MNKDRLFESLPSLELLSQVLKTPITKMDPQERSNYLGYYTPNPFELDEITEHKINIYELTYKIKQWCLTKGFQVNSYRPIVQDDEGRQVINYWFKAYIFQFTPGSYERPEQILTINIDAPSEFQAVVKAGEYVLNKIKELEKIELLSMLR